MSLFHVVVEDDEVASKLMRELQRRKAGRVTFKPLNRCRAREKANERGAAERGGEVFDKKNHDNAALMIDQIKFQERFRPAMKGVFGRTLVCANEEVASALGRRYDCDAVAVDGTLVERRGAMKGGYYDPKKSRMKAAHDAHAAKALLETIEARGKQPKDTPHPLSPALACLPSLPAAATQPLPPRSRSKWRGRG